MLKIIIKCNEDPLLITCCGRKQSDTHVENPHSEFSDEMTRYHFVEIRLNLSV